MKDLRKTRTRLIGISVGTIAMLALAACNDDDGLEEAAEEVGEDVEDAADDVQDAVDDAVDEIDDG